MQTLFVALVVLATIRIGGLTESSGLAASQRSPGVYWTINDSPPPLLYAFDRTGSLRARVHVSRASVSDWEALSSGPGPIPGRSYLYVGDIGDNSRRRTSIEVYRFEEPALSAKRTRAAERIRLKYPDGPHDAEALLVHPKTGDLYIVTKSSERNSVYKAKAPLSVKTPIQLQRIAAVQLPAGSLLTMFVGRITGGDISPDGHKVVLCDYDSAWEAVAAGKDFDAIWKGPWRRVDIGPRRQGEAVVYRHDGETMLATSEGEEFRLVEADASR